MTETSSKERVPLPPLGIALIPIAFLLATMGVTIGVYRLDPHLPLAASTIVAALVAKLRGIPWRTLELGMIHGIRVGLKAIVILMVIGLLIASWIASGVVPYLIYLGLELISPSVFLPTACLICSVISLATGSSWTTAGTVGVALMGVGGGMGIPPAMVAGAVVSGAYFGDKISPLSDSTNLAPAVTGVELFEHIRHMLFTTVPAMAIALILYSILGYTLDVGETSIGEISSLQASLDEQFQLHPALLLAPLLVVVLSALRISALPALVAAVGAGAFFAMALQGMALPKIISVMHYGYVSEIGAERIDELLSGGGLDNMMWTISLILCALSFGGILEGSRMLEAIAAAILRGISGAANLVAATVATCLTMNVIAPDQYLSIIVPGRMYREAFLQRGLAPKNLSRTVEDAGTLSSPLVPWNTCGATMMAALTVNPFDYLPYAFVNLLTPVIAIAWAYLGIAQAKAET